MKVPDLTVLLVPYMIHSFAGSADWIFFISSFKNWPTVLDGSVNNLCKTVSSIFSSQILVECMFGHFTWLPWNLASNYYGTGKYERSSNECDACFPTLLLLNTQRSTDRPFSKFASPLANLTKSSWFFYVTVFILVQLVIYFV